MGMIPKSESKQHILWFESRKHPGPALVCTCGWGYYHKREAIMERAARKHQLKHGAVWANKVVDLP
jgi:hypothetical protein